MFHSMNFIDVTRIRLREASTYRGLFCSPNQATCRPRLSLHLRATEARADYRHAVPWLDDQNAFVSSHWMTIDFVT